MAKRKPPSPFLRFNSSPEIIRLVVLLYVKYPLSLRNVEDLLAERGIEICHETVRFWWNRFGPMLAIEIRRKRVDAMRQHTHWRWHLDEVFLKINGASLIWSSPQGDWRRRPPGNGPPIKQSGREQPPAFSTTRTGDAAVSQDEALAEIRFRPCFSPQPFQSGSPSHQPKRLQSPTLGRLGWVKIPHGMTEAWAGALAPERGKVGV